VTLLLPDLELAWRASLSDEPGDFDAYLRARAVPEDVICRLRNVRDSRQLDILLELKKAERRVRNAVDILTLDTEYLREELEQQLAQLRTLFVKMERDVALRQDREALHQGMLEHVGGADADSDGTGPDER
jgi:hypothetical protein